MPPTNWHELVRAVDDGPNPPAIEISASAPENEDNASFSNPYKTKRDRSLRAWRRSERVRTEMLVDVCLCEEDGEPVFTRGKTVDVSAHGALLDVTMPVDIGQTLRLVNLRTKREIECHVLRFAKRYPEGGGQIAVEFAGMSRHFWDIPSPPADWDPNWAPNATPQRPHPTVPAAQPLPRGSADASPNVTPGERSPSKSNVPSAVAAVKNLLKNPRLLKWAVLALVSSTVLFILWAAIQGSKDANSTNAFPAGVAPEDASRIPRIERTRLATLEDFDPDAISWLRSSGLEATGKIPGFYSGSKKSNAYILVGKANERQVVILAGGQLQYNAEYPRIAIAACIPMELVRKIKWADAAPPESDGDGLLLVRAADAPASGVVLFLRSSQVVSATPVDYREVTFGQGCQP